MISNNIETRIDSIRFDVFLGGQSSDIKNIVRTLQHLFDDERFDLVPSDVAAGIILLQQEDVLQERSINIIENVPLEILKEGLYYNLYAQSAFGWYEHLIIYILIHFSYSFSFFVCKGFL